MIANTGSHTSIPRARSMMRLRGLVSVLQSSCLARSGHPTGRSKEGSGYHKARGTLEECTMPPDWIFLPLLVAASYSLLYLALMAVRLAFAQEREIKVCDL